MAKGGHKKKEKAKHTDATVAASPAANERDKSLISAAFRLYEIGDVVGARAKAKLALGLSAPAAVDEADSKKVAAKLFPEKPEATRSYAEVAKELIARTSPPPKAYVFAAVTVLLFILMLVLAAARS